MIGTAIGFPLSQDRSSEPSKAWSEIPLELAENLVKISQEIQVFLSSQEQTTVTAIADDPSSLDVFYEKLELVIAKLNQLFQEKKSEHQL